MSDFNPRPVSGTQLTMLSRMTANLATTGEIKYTFLDSEVFKLGEQTLVEPNQEIVYYDRDALQEFPGYDDLGNLEPGRTYAMADVYKILISLYFFAKSQQS